MTNTETAKSIVSIHGVNSEIGKLAQNFLKCHNHLKGVLEISHIGEREWTDKENQLYFQACFFSDETKRQWTTGHVIKG